MSKTETAQAKSSTELLSNNNDSSSNGTLTVDGITFKRPASESDGEIKYIRAKELKAGQTAVTGIYLGSSQNRTYPEKLDFSFKLSDGTKAVVNEGGNLKFRLSKVEAGQMVAVIYQGMTKILKGPRAGKSAHNFEVLIAE